MTTTTTMIREREHGIAFEGSPEEAMEFVSSTREFHIDPSPEDAANWLALLKDIVTAADANDGGSLMNCIEDARVATDIASAAPTATRDDLVPARTATAASALRAARDTIEALYSDLIEATNGDFEARENTLNALRQIDTALAVLKD
jgi:hypothetical protein